MQGEDLRSNMMSRLGKACHENIMLVDRAQHVITARKETFDIEESGLIASYNRKRGGNAINIKDILRKADEEDGNVLVFPENKNIKKVSKEDKNSVLNCTAIHYVAVHKK